MGYPAPYWLWSRHIQSSDCPALGQVYLSRAAMEPARGGTIAPPLCESGWDLEREPVPAATPALSG